jgi:hypothetical protein
MATVPQPYQVVLQKAGTWVEFNRERVKLARDTGDSDGAMRTMLAEYLKRAGVIFDVDGPSVEEQAHRLETRTQYEKKRAYERAAKEKAKAVISDRPDIPGDESRFKMVPRAEAGKPAPEYPEVPPPSVVPLHPGEMSKDQARGSMRTIANPEDVEWAVSMLTVHGVHVRDAPSPAAWSLYQWAKRTNDNQRFLFERIWTRCMPSKRELDRHAASIDENRDLRKALHACAAAFHRRKNEQELKAFESGGGDEVS